MSTEDWIVAGFLGVLYVGLGCCVAFWPTFRELVKSLPSELPGMLERWVERNKGA